MSKLQGKSTKISAEPREVVDTTSTAPGTARATSSSGSVTSISICLDGMLPALTSMRMRGKLVTGKQADWQGNPDEQARQRERNGNAEQCPPVVVEKLGKHHSADPLELDSRTVIPS